MEFLQVTSPEDYRAEEIYNAYTASFPEDERRSTQQYAQLFKNPSAKIYTILNGLDFVGYFIGWELSNFIFLEHFEIFPQYRHQSFGSKTIADLFQNYSKIVLEAEPEHWGSEATQRIEFYRKNGFMVIDEEYIQPSYSAEKNAVKLWLMSNSEPENLSKLKEEIYDVVYRI